ncbi:glutathione S-transferase Mu 3-like protein [Tribonema minus]|uniref:glutathione transferase n=1 Tax=Tribonema minus TaxID=303371 RepID=A0A835YVD5_9STRA|nr:glutathione S-transferase Mu 3-like protein [Tribonema minus]
MPPAAAAAAVPTLGYMDARGIAEPIRCLLHYCNVNFNDKRYPDKAAWLREKHALGLPFPNLPYAGVKLTQTTAVLQHIGREQGLVGKSPAQVAEIDMLTHVALDMANGLICLCYSTPDQYHENLPNFIKQIPTWLDPLDAYLGTKDWFAGELSTADFVLYDRLSVFNAFQPGCVDSHASLKGFMERFRGLKVVSEYLASPEHMTRRVFGPESNWNFCEQN